MDLAAKEHRWKLDFAEIAKIWRAGCIIRAVFLQSITHAYEQNEHLANLLVDPFFTQQIVTYQQDWRSAISHAVLSGVPCPAMTSALSYYDSYRMSVLPANLLQGQRDFFGAHTFQRVDKADGKRYHVEWNDPKRPQVRIKK
jgi:6-phosphogluconate dehydrogenase